MPAGITIFVECLADNRASDVGIAPYLSIGARCIECGGIISRRLNINRLSGRWISWTDSIELKVRGETGLVNNVARFYADVSVEIDFDMHIGFNVDAASDVAGYVNIDVSLGGSNLIDRQVASKRRDHIVVWNARGPGY